MVMYLNYSEQGTVKVYMIQYLYIVLQYFPEHLGPAAATLSADHLFKVRDESEKHYLPEEQLQNFHFTLVQLLFISSRAC